MTIRDAIKQMAAAGTEPYCKVCTVDEVDEAARTVDCTPIDESAPLLGVNLQANQDSVDGIVQFPTTGSYVLVAFISESVAAVVLCEKVDKIVMRVGSITAEIVNEKITVNGGVLGGLVIGQKTADKLNVLERDINALKSVLASWTPVSQDGGLALKTAVAAWTGQQLMTTAAADLEDNKILH